MDDKIRQSRNQIPTLDHLFDKRIEALELQYQIKPQQSLFSYKKGLILVLSISVILLVIILNIKPSIPYQTIIKDNKRLMNYVYNESVKDKAFKPVEIDQTSDFSKYFLYDEVVLEDSYYFIALVDLGRFSERYSLNQTEDAVEFIVSKVRLKEKNSTSWVKTSVLFVKIGDQAIGLLSTNEKDENNLYYSDHHYLYQEKVISYNKTEEQTVTKLSNDFTHLYVTNLVNDVGSGSYSPIIEDSYSLIRSEATIDFSAPGKKIKTSMTFSVVDVLEAVGHQKLYLFQETFDKDVVVYLNYNQKTIISDLIDNIITYDQLQKGDEVIVSFETFYSDYLPLNIYPDEIKLKRTIPNEAFIVFEINEFDAYDVVGLKEGMIPKTLVIPSSYLGKPVTSIKKEAFSSSRLIDDITFDALIIEEGIKEIKESAFAGIHLNNDLVIPVSVTLIEKQAFYSIDVNVSFHKEHINLVLEEHAFSLRKLSKDEVRTISLPSNYLSTYQTLYRPIAGFELLVDQSEYEAYRGLLDLNHYYPYETEFLKSEDYVYVLLKDELELVYYTGDETNLSIKEQINGINVTSLSSNLFSRVDDMHQFTKIVIPKTVSQMTHLTLELNQTQLPTFVFLSLTPPRNHQALITILPINLNAYFVVPLDSKEAYDETYGLLQIQERVTYLTKEALSRYE